MSTPPHLPATPASPDHRGLAAFLLITCAFSWTALLPLALHWPGASVFVVLSMFGPSVATAVVLWRFARVPHAARATGLHLGRRWMRFWALAWLGIPALVLASLALSVLLGRYALDLGELSGFRALLEKSEGGRKALAHLGPHVLLGVQVGTGLLVGPLLNLPVALGEEWGWRGWLLPRLLPLGQLRALALSGILWGLWHAPITLLGHNYPQQRVAGVFFMGVFCVLLGTLLGWMRLATGSIWPAVIAHGSLNALAPLVLVLGRADVPVDTAQAGLTGWPGWLLMAALVALLVATRRLPVREAPAVEHGVDAAME